MAHYAFLDENNVVIEVITGKDENDLDPGVTDWETWYGQFRGRRCLRTSYNTHGNVHSYGGVPFRYNFAQIGGAYREDKDGFVPPKPHNLTSWILDEETLTWVAPVQRPDDDHEYLWVEEEQRWIVKDEAIAYLIAKNGETGGNDNEGTSEDK